MIVALGRLLTKCGFEHWDLGMDLEYKRRLGAELLPRADFVDIVRRSRVENKGVVLQCGGERRIARELIDWELANNGASAVGKGNASQSTGDQKKVKPQNRKRPHEEEGGMKE